MLLGQLIEWLPKCLVVVSCLFALTVQLPCCAEIKPNLVDPYLQREFDWAMYLDARTVDHYLNYTGSTLHPLMRARIRYRYFARRLGPAKWPARTYDELWYHDGKPVGMRRYGQLKIDPRDIGTVIIGFSDNRVNSSLAITDALVRLLVEMQFQRAVVSVVVVPAEQYSQILANLQLYHITTEMPRRRGPQMSIHFRSDPPGQEHYLYLHGG